MDIIESEKFIKNNFMGKIFNIFSNYGSFIQIDFSEKEADGNNIFVYMCAWNIYHNDIEILNNNDDRAKFSHVFDDLIRSGNSVIDFLFDPIKHMFIFYLCDNYSIIVFPDNDFLDDDMIVFLQKSMMHYAIMYEKAFIMIVQEYKWQEKINNLPGECDSLTEGFLLKIYGDCFSPDWEKEDAVINHLGREYIADIKTFYKENNLIPVEEKV